MRNGFLPGEQERKPFFKKRAVSFSVSLALHALFIYGFFHAPLRIKLLPLGREVRNVRLAPPVRMTFPGRIEDYVQNYPAPGPFELGTRPPTARSVPSPKEAPGIPPGNVERRKSGLAPENLMKNGPGTPQTSGEFPSEDLALSSKSWDGRDGKLRINLLAIPDHVQDAPLGFEGGVPSGRSFRRYVLPGLASARGGRGGRAPGTLGGTGEGGQRASAVFQSPGYDISLWAAKVMDLVQLNWAIPSAPNLTGRSEVRIAITIERNGAFSAFEVSELAELELFNSAASTALRASEPFPSLPDDFPAANLAAVFIFTYHD